MARLFLAVRPPDVVRVELVGLQARMGARMGVRMGEGVRLVPPAQLHVTLAFWPDADTEQVGAALDAIELPAANAVVGPAGGSLGRDPVVMPVTLGRRRHADDCHRGREV